MEYRLTLKDLPAEELWSRGVIKCRIIGNNYKNRK